MNLFMESILITSLWNEAAANVCSHQRFCKQLCPMLCGELQRFRPLVGAFAECEVELCPLTFSYWTDSADVSIRPLKNKHANSDMEEMNPQHPAKQSISNMF